jgi:hypothetical protein
MPFSHSAYHLLEQLFSDSGEAQKRSVCESRHLDGICPLGWCTDVHAQQAVAEVERHARSSSQ